MSTSASPQLIAGVDLGGTKVLASVATLDGQILATDRRPTEAEKGPQAVVQRIIDLVGDVCRVAGTTPSRLKAVGIAVPGPVHQESGVVTDPPNLPGWHNVPIGPILSDALGTPTVVDNDGNAAAIGEHRFGAGVGTRHMLYLTVSTGVGGGIIINGELYRGASGAAGELGHIIIEADGPACGCGAHGCLEALASGTAIAREARAVLASGYDGILATLCAGGEVDAEVVAEAADAGDRAAAEIIARAAHYLGLGLATFVNLFNPEMIVIGGGAAKIGLPLLAPAEQTMRKVAFPLPASAVSIVRSPLEDDAVVRGAIALVQAVARNS
jgi:glucokinase